MGKRGMSLLISFVLLVGFTILMAAFITTWSVNRVKDIPVDGLGGAYCDDVRIDVTLGSKGVDTLDIDVVNEGVFTVNRLTIQRETYTASDARPLASCIVLNTGLAPGATITKTLRLGRINEVFGDQVIECDSIQSESTCISVRSLAIVPWVSIEGEDIACNDRKANFLGEDYQEILHFCP
ncbi:hypothetical protein HYT51_00655 [Candidatus Woesearchaeota archaeon]|nr:hypothetical protein [Candidatus Woesearchaeota archaeon]